MQYLICDDTIYSLLLGQFQTKNEIIHPSTIFFSPSDYQTRNNNVHALPLVQFRIHNINYCRSNQRSLGAPYWAHIQNNIPELIKDSLQERGIEVIVRPLENDKQLKNLLLLNRKLINWLQDPQNKEAHNDRIEREIVADELIKRGIHFDSIYQTSLSDEVAQKPISLERYLIKKLQIDTSLIQYKHYPLHRYYKKHFNIDLPINLNERSIYGEVDM